MIAQQRSQLPSELLVSVDVRSTPTSLVLFFYIFYKVNVSPWPSLLQVSSGRLGASTSCFDSVVQAELWGCLGRPGGALRRSWKGRRPSTVDMFLLVHMIDDSTPSQAQYVYIYIYVGSILLPVAVDNDH